jgi:hypothetical protein
MEFLGDMKIRKFIYLVFLLFFTLPFIYGGCTVYFSSGNYPEKKPENDQPPAEIAGGPQQAFINPDNAEKLTAGALLASLNNAAPQCGDQDQSTDFKSSGAFRPLRLTQALGDSLRSIKFSVPPLALDNESVQTEIGDLRGNCGGALSYALWLNSFTGVFSGNLSYNDYCDNGVVFNGDADVEGSYDLDASVYLSAYFYLEHFSDGTITLDAEISIDFSDSPTLVTFNGLATHAASGQRHRLNSYSLNIFELSGYREIEVFGSYFHPDHGHVNISTPEPFIVHHEDQWPTSGKLVITGDQNTRAELETLAFGLYVIETDADGNGATDQISEIRDWSVIGIDMPICP